MTRKDYQLLADIINVTANEDSMSPQGKEAITVLATRLADALYMDNPRFIYLRFFIACGIDSPHD